MKEEGEKVLAKIDDMIRCMDFFDKLHETCLFLDSYDFFELKEYLSSADTVYVTSDYPTEKSQWGYNEELDREVMTVRRGTYDLTIIQI